jgi:arylsulfatase B
MKWQHLTAGLVSLIGAMTPVIPLHAETKNVLIIVADDMGSDIVPGFGFNKTSKPPMPNVTALANAGVKFTNAWASPLCSPTRACMLTGRHSFRTGVGYAIGGNTDDPGIPTSEPTIAKGVKSAKSLATAAFGKWHLSDANNGGADNPINMGFNYYAGSLIGALNVDNSRNNYTKWTKTINTTSLAETVSTSSTYATTDTATEALNWITARGTNPWLAWVAFNAPHTPNHKPNNSLHSYDSLSGTSSDIRNNPRPYFEAMCEALDTEIGRLVNGISADVKAKTLIIFIGDNGTYSQVKNSGYRSSKGSLYEGGIRVPLILSGADVVSPGRNVSTVVSHVDVYSTVLRSLGIDPATVSNGATIDSVSMRPYITSSTASAQRTWTFTELFSEDTSLTNTGEAIRNSRYKLIRFTNGNEEFYDLQNDTQEATNLLLNTLSSDAQSNYNTLSSQLNSLGNS